MKMNRFLILLLCLSLLLAGCGTAGSEALDKGYMDNDYAVRETIPGAEVKGESGESLTSSTTTDPAAVTGRKLIRTITLDAETEHFDDLLTNLTGKISELGGYVEDRRVESSGYYSSRSSRYCSMTIRIPADALDGFLTHVSENANVTSTSESTRDVTLEYVDTEAKITALETEQTRLLELLANAQNLSEILEIEARLSDVTYELERYASQLRSYDNLVTFATVNLTLREVTQLTPTAEPTVWERITEGFGESLEDLGDDITDGFVWFVVNSPYLVVWALITGVVLGAIIHTQKKHRAAKAARSQSEPPQN